MYQVRAPGMGAPPRHPTTMTSSSSRHIQLPRPRVGCPSLSRGPNNAMHRPPRSATITTMKGRHSYQCNEVSTDNAIRQTETAPSTALNSLRGPSEEMDEGSDGFRRTIKPTNPRGPDKTRPRATQTLQLVNSLGQTDSRDVNPRKNQATSGRRSKQGPSGQNTAADLNRDDAFLTPSEIRARQRRYDMKRRKTMMKKRSLKRAESSPTIGGRDTNQVSESVRTSSPTPHRRHHVITPPSSQLSKSNSNQGTPKQNDGIPELALFETTILTPDYREGQPPANTMASAVFSPADSSLTPSLASTIKTFGANEEDDDYIDLRDTNEEQLPKWLSIEPETLSEMDAFLARELDSTTDEGDDDDDDGMECIIEPIGQQGNNNDTLHPTYHHHILPTKQAGKLSTARMKKRVLELRLVSSKYKNSSNAKTSTHPQQQKQNTRDSMVAQAQNDSDEDDFLGNIGNAQIPEYELSKTSTDSQDAMKENEDKLAISSNSTKSYGDHAAETIALSTLERFKNKGKGLPRSLSASFDDCKGHISDKQQQLFRRNDVEGNIMKTRVPAPQLPALC